MSEAVRYTVLPADPAGHLLDVTCTVSDPDPAGQCFSLPAWIPGSYMIRDFARNIVRIAAAAGGRAVRLEKCDKHSWRAAPMRAKGPLQLSYRVYAWDLSVRSAHFDESHAFFNGTSVFLNVHGQEDRECLVELQRPGWPAAERWKVATAMAEAKGVEGAARRHGFGWYRASSYDELIDHPVEMGEFTLARFKAAGVSHEMVITGRHDCDMARLCEDLERICEWQVGLFGSPAPMKRYLFLTTVVGSGYGGLEHRASTALLASRNDLPYAGMKGRPKAYRDFLGLCSHEYFHSWNVKRIRPQAFTPYDLSCENYTRLLWAFEGITSYYDDLALVRSGVVSSEDYLAQLATTIGRVLRGGGRLLQSVAESSFDAWTKFYRQDENAPNAIVSYYAKGALVALATDLQLRIASDGKASLDDVMRLLWTRHGASGVGVPEDGVFDAVAEIGGAPLARWLRKAVEGTQDLPLARWLKAFGVALERKGGESPDIGAKFADGAAEARLERVFSDGAAHRAGLSAGDVLVAMDDLRVDAKSIGPMLARRQPGERLRLHAFRRDELRCFDLTLEPPARFDFALAINADSDAKQRKLRLGWLGRRD